MPVMIEPIGDRERGRVVAETFRYVELAEALYGHTFPMPPVDFTLRGTSAGMFQVKGAEVRIRYNPWLFAKFYDDNVTTTVPHEVAHYIVHCLHDLRRVRPHGAEWQAIMRDFGADARVTSDFDLSGIPTRRQRRFRYACGCREHAISTRRHNASQRGWARYACRLCNGELVFMGE